MGRTVVRQVDSRRSRRTRDGLAMALLGLVLVFAVVGLASAGMFVASKVNGAPAHTAGVAGTRPTSGGAATELSRARIQATAIVKAGEDSATAYLTSARNTAKRKSATIIAAAHKQAAQIAARGASPRVAVAQPQPQAVPAATSAAPTYTAPGYAQGQPAPIIPTAAPALTRPNGAAAPDLRGVPATWQVVGYNASFGSGPGSAGSISVINRGSQAMSGVATVHYSSGGSASAVFQSLAPGQALILPLNGPAYKGGGYHIVLGSLH